MKVYECGYKDTDSIKIVAENPLLAIEKYKKLINQDENQEYYAIDVKENKKYYEGF